MKEENKPIKVRPCPFCGGDILSAYYTKSLCGEGYSIFCDECETQGPVARHTNDNETDDALIEDAALLWNNRDNDVVGCLNLGCLNLESYEEMREVGFSGGRKEYSTDF